MPIQKKTMRRFLIFSQPRCGSTTLMRSLSCHPDIDCANEPFNANTSPFPELLPVTDAASMAVCLDRLWESYNGIKHVTHYGSWPFPKDEADELNRRLLLGNWRVILLNRRNLLQQAVSNAVALHRRVFTTDDVEAKPSRRIPALNRWALAAFMEGTNRRRIEREEILRERNVEYTRLWYEDFLGPDLDAAARHAALDSILSVLGRSLDDDGVDLAKISELLDPARSKVTTGAVYKKIRGIKKIDRLLGSDETGWLFR